MRISNWVLSATLAVLCGGISVNPAAAEQSSRLGNLDAIGRLVVAQKSMCTGALVAPDLVLTAAHCLYDTSSGHRLSEVDMVFQAGVSSGRAKFTRAVEASWHHEDYEFRRGRNAKVDNDLAMLKLTRPLSSKHVKPIAFEAPIKRSDALSVVAYNFRNLDDPNIIHPCNVLARRNDTVVISCQVDFGASGAPVLSVVKGQAPSIVSVISAKADMGGRNVAVGTALDFETLYNLMQPS